MVNDRLVDGAGRRCEKAADLEGQRSAIPLTNALIRRRESDEFLHGMRQNYSAGIRLLRVKDRVAAGAAMSYNRVELKQGGTRANRNAPRR